MINMRTKIIVFVFSLLISNLLNSQKVEKEKNIEKNELIRIESLNKDIKDKFEKALKENPDGKIESIGDDKVISVKEYWFEVIKWREARFDTSYSFNNKVHIQTETVGKKGVFTSNCYFFFNDSTPHSYTEIEIVQDKGKKPNSTQILSIADGTCKCSITLVNMNKMNFRLTDTIPDMNKSKELTSEKAKEKLNKGTITKTGDSKVIAGYNCDEYSFEDNEEKYQGKLWISIDINLKTSIDPISKTKLSAYTGYSTLEGGVIIAMESNDEKEGIATKSEVKGIDFNIGRVVPANEFFNPKTGINIITQLLRTYKCQSGMEITVELPKINK
jgi:hypothetical protein